MLETDIADEVKRKQELFNRINPTIQFVRLGMKGKWPSFGVLQNQVKVTLSQTNLTDSQFARQRTREELFNDIVQNAYDKVIYELERGHDEFNLIAPLYSTKPLSSKIGKKEGLHTDMRFFVYEHRYDISTQSITEIRRGVIRSTSKITDNRGIATEDMKPSAFYQVAGRQLNEGYVIKQDNDRGIQLDVYYADAAARGLTTIFYTAFGRRMGLKSFYTGIILGFESGEYSPFASYDFDGNITFIKYGVGMAKGFHFLRNFELRPHIAF